MLADLLNSYALKWYVVCNLKNHLRGQILHRSLDPSKNGVITVSKLECSQIKKNVQQNGILFGNTQKVPLLIIKYFMVNIFAAQIFVVFNIIWHSRTLKKYFLKLRISNLFISTRLLWFLRVQSRRFYH
mgnify:CR=1 FL=1